MPSGKSTIDLELMARKIRELRFEDMENGFLTVLGQLTDVGECEMLKRKKLFDEITQNPFHNVYVMTDKDSERVIAAGTILIEKKFIHGCKSVGHIEDVVVDETMRGQGLGRLMVKKLTQIAMENSCYKVILDCLPDRVGFYEKCSMKTVGVEMAVYVEE
eukprot:TRINITY_DN58154_c0_g1_i1.p1 TRINITY_DN58154_c0_g1~~TRINITY_DN58154_c0_g1_i1.p1  ORF type:complete len:185 (-),score=53.34 TRINITY_DN58154_c0_g1_i1:441-920(-)